MPACLALKERQGVICTMILELTLIPERVYHVINQQR